MHTFNATIYLSLTHTSCLTYMYFPHPPNNLKDIYQSLIMYRCIHLSKWFRIFWWEHNCVWTLCDKQNKKGNPFLPALFLLLYCFCLGVGAYPLCPMDPTLFEHHLMSASQQMGQCKNTLIYKCILLCCEQIKQGLLFSLLFLDYKCT